MTTNTIKWLHLSDFHVGKDDFGNIQLFDSILKYIDSKQQSGDYFDFIFFTGDLAYSGKEKEYELFASEFILPLSEISSKTVNLFFVPGNHDVDRMKARAIKKHGVLTEIPEFLDPTSLGKSERSALFPRFDQYNSSDFNAFTHAEDNWLFSDKGYYIWTKNIKSIEFGVVGLNTAWFAEGDDKNKLTPGLATVKEAIRAIDSCDFKIVLGHHPLDWFDEDEGPIKSIFGKSGVIYLHGHLHRNSGNIELGAGHHFLTLQAGASFAARESEKWINRFLDCELLISEASVRIKPMQWSKQYQDWCMDGLAYPDIFRNRGTDYWDFPIKYFPNSAKLAEFTSTNQRNNNFPPVGWHYIDEQFIKEQSQPLSNDQIINFFDGSVPSLQIALSSQIPKRKVVKEILNNIKDGFDNSTPKVNLIIGAGGEGKSTVFFQVLTVLGKSYPDYKILWLSNAAKDITWPYRFLTDLFNNHDCIVIATDDADLVSNRIFEALKASHRLGKKKIQFLLCTRDSDWISSKSNLLDWRDYTVLNEIRLRGISKKDAELIVQGWSKFGNRGLGNLQGVDLPNAIELFFNASKSEEKKYVDEGAFLGAMLQVRMGDQLKLHVNKLLDRLHSQSIKERSLMDAFAYIAAMHSEQLFILTKDVLAEVMLCKINDVKRKIIGPLGDEAAASTRGDVIFTRHRAIADVALELLNDTFHVDFDEIFIELAEAAYRLSLKGTYIDNFYRWKFLSEHFVKKGNLQLGIRICQSLRKIDPSDSRLISHQSRLFRDADRPDLSSKLFRELDHGVTNGIRTFYVEWGTVEGINEKFALSICLLGIALSDNIENKRIDKETSKFCLSGLAISSYQLYSRYKNKIFLDCCYSASKLGLDIGNLNIKEKEIFNEFLNRSVKFGAREDEIKSSIKTIHSAVIFAWEQKEDKLDDWVYPPYSLTYDWVEKLV